MDWIRINSHHVHQIQRNQIKRFQMILTGYTDCARQDKRSSSLLLFIIILFLSNFFIFFSPSTHPVIHTPNFNL